MAERQAEGEPKTVSERATRERVGPTGPPVTLDIAARLGVRGVSRLMSGRLHPPQRRALAASIGRMHGNRHLQRILGTGLRPPIQRTTDPAAHSLSGALTEEERQRIRVVTAQVTLDDLPALFSTEGATLTVPLPEGVTPNYAGAIPDGLRRGLSNVAGRLIQNRVLPVNATTTVALNLTAFGGDSSAYRFTFVEHTPAGGEASREVLIERLGEMGAEGLSGPQREAQQARFTQHGFRRGSGWSESEYGALLEAIAQLPDGMLTPVDGLTFRQEERHPTDPQAGGSYDPRSHTVVLYNHAFGASVSRFGTPGSGAVSSGATRAVIHEIGHAIDLLPLRRAWSGLEAAEEALRLAFQQYEDPPDSGQYLFPSSEQGRYDRLQREITQAEQALTGARSESGYRWEESEGEHDIVEGGTAAGSNEFRRAAEQDGGVRVTEYSDREWQEYYAESFSLYISDPIVLQQLRRHVYDYFVTHHPR